MNDILISFINICLAIVTGILVDRIFAQLHLWLPLSVLLQILILIVLVKLLDTYVWKKLLRQFGVSTSISDEIFFIAFYLGVQLNLFRDIGLIFRDLPSEQSTPASNLVS